MDTPSTKSAFTYPLRLKDEINSVTQGKYQIHQHFGGYLINDKRKKQALEEILSVIDLRVHVAEHLMQKYPWDFFMIKFDNPDQVQHYFWKDMNSDEKSTFRDAILKVYEHLDSILGKFMKLMDEDTTLMVISDHGAGPVIGKKIYINEWLRRKGMLYTKDNFDGKKKNIRNRLRKLLMRSLEKLYFRAGKVTSHRLRDRLGISLHAMKARRLSLTHSNTDWLRTKAYFGGNLNAIYINLEGRRPYGVVKPGTEYEQVREEIIDGLKALLDPDDGQPVFEHVYKKEEVYHGSLLDEAPDILVVPRNFSDYTMGKEILNSDNKPVIASQPSQRGVTGNHRLNGIFLSYGKCIRGGKQIQGAKIIDLFPTIYHVFGLQIPADIDGKPLTSIFTPEWLSENPVRFSDTATGIGEIKEDVYSEEDEAEIRERLKGLGYI
jgi:predicted AlkP superfamily phosphohydrolase/phosphomutase